MQDMGTDESTPPADPERDAMQDGATQDDATQDAAGDEDETRRKFREALARKQGHVHLGGTTTAATPAKRGRTFRRKSG